MADFLSRDFLSFPVRANPALKGNEARAPDSEAFQIKLVYVTRKVFTHSLPPGQVQGFAFPQLALSPILFNRIWEDHATMIQIAPWSPERQWFLELVNALADSSRSLLNRTDLALSADREAPSPESQPPAPDCMTLIGRIGR